MFLLVFFEFIDYFWGQFQYQKINPNFRALTKAQWVTFWLLIVSIEINIDKSGFVVFARRSIILLTWD
jgi:hypothetical protein